MSSPRTDVVYGLHAVRALLARQPQRVRRLLLQRGREDARVQELVGLAEAARCPLERVAPERLVALVGEAAHQGVVAQVQALAAWNEDALLAAVTAPTEPPVLLALDGVQDPHNLGACLRTADACGALAVIIPRDRAAPLNATARKVASGAAESTPVAVVTNLSRTLALLKQAGLWIVGAAADAPRRAQEVDLTVPCVLVLGAEGRGLRELTRRHCDWLVRLPASGAAPSLNVSVAAGMLLYERLRQRGSVAP